MTRKDQIPYREIYAARKQIAKILWGYRCFVKNGAMPQDSFQPVQELEKALKAVSLIDVWDGEDLLGISGHDFQKVEIFLREMLESSIVIDEQSVRDMLQQIDRHRRTVRYFSSRKHSGYSLAA